MKSLTDSTKITKSDNANTLLTAVGKMDNTLIQEQQQLLVQNLRQQVKSV